MAMPTGALHRWSPHDVRSLIAANPLHSPRYELVAGQLLVSPSPGFHHQKAVQILFAELDPYLRQSGAAHAKPNYAAPDYRDVLSCRKGLPWAHPHLRALTLPDERLVDEY